MPVPVTGIWVIPSNWYSTGSSMVTTFLVGSLTSPSVAYSVVVLPEPVGPVHRIIPRGERAISR